MSIFGLAPNGSPLGLGEHGPMAYIVHRNRHFYVVAYDGVDPISGRERRRWHPAGESRGDAEAIAATLTVRSVLTAPAGLLAVGSFLAEQWMPRRRTQLRPTTAHRYAWMIERYICPRIGDRAAATVACRSPRPAVRRPPRSRRAHRRSVGVEDRVRRARHRPLGPVHATRRQLVDVNVALSPQRHDPNPAHAADPRPGPPSSSEPSSTAQTTCGSTRRCTWPP